MSHRARSSTSASCNDHAVARSTGSVRDICHHIITIRFEKDRSQFRRSTAELLMALGHIRPRYEPSDTHHYAREVRQRLSCPPVCLSPATKTRRSAICRRCNLASIQTRTSSRLLSPWVTSRFDTIPPLLQGSSTPSYLTKCVRTR